MDDRLVNHRTPEDNGKIMSKIIERHLKKYAHQQKKECDSGVHGFNTESWFSGGMIYTRCKRCGASWSRPDLPMTI